ncbi:D-alanyl-D-alanine carboxypeptidase [Streptomyces sp. NPDC059002]|uniref:D-alanyl-D-alanine carboxypeptidase n=1 Tax=Streptomyces sp. NPDC059002 TaxID=3346690 RepID=UPI00367EAB32
MAYEEASVAGETPDRSKQRKSSGNPTAADSAPVPEERDPRLAMTRETPQAREDTATAVFSTKTVNGAKAPEASEEPEASDVPEAPEASDAPEAPSGENGDARLRAAVAAWVAGDEESADEAAAPAEPEADKGTDAEADAEADADGSGTDGSGTDEGSTDDADAADSARGNDSSGEDVTSTDAEADADADAGAPAEDDAKDDAKDGSDSDSDSATDDASSGEADDKSAEKADAKPDDDSAKSDATPADASAETPKTPEAPKAPKAPETGVDQATAVFKALPADAAGKGVDQATTMLKLGDLKSPEEPKGESAKGTAKPEGDAERTSKFVALKPLDEPAPKPAPKPAPAGAAKGEGADEGRATDKKAAAAPAATGPAVPPPVERTTQQPLPPKPPIDLLAELTNTPPPPETPVRTAVRRVKIWTPLVLLLVVVFAVVQAVRPLPTPTLQLTAQESVSFAGDKPSVPWPGQGQAAMDVNGIGTFGTSGEQKPVPIASIAKVMTVYLILRDHPLKKGEDGPKIPVDAAAQKHYETGKPANESVVKVTEGQKLSEYEALQAVMLPSANNVAKLLARWDTNSTSEDEFVAKMNKTAKELGMKNTHYTDPSGLDKTTVSTAEDLVKLGRAAMENPVFNEISRQPSYKDLNGDKQNNFFGLVPTVAIGIKTGTTTAAGGNILFAAEKVIDGKPQTIIGAALGQYGNNGVANIDEVTKVTRQLIEAGKDALTAKTIVKKGAVVGQVDDGLGGTTPVVATKDVSAVGWSGLTVKLELDAEKGKSLPHSAKAGTKVGVLSVGDGKGDAVEVPVALQKDLSEPSFGAKLKRVG